VNSVTDWQRERLVPLYGNLPVGELLQKWWDSLGYPVEDTLSNQKLYNRYKLFLPDATGSVQDLAWQFWSQGLLGSAIRLPGITGNYISTPDSVINSITGDLDIRVKVSVDNWALAQEQNIIGKYTTTGNQRSYRLYLTSTGNQLQFASSADGTAGTVSALNRTIAYPAGSTKYIKVTHDVDNGAGGNVITIFDSDDGIIWTQLNTVTNTGVHQRYDSTAVLEIGSATNGAFPLAGIIYYAEVRNGIDGPVVAKYDSSDVVVTGTRLPATINGWTINGTGITKPDVDYLKLPGTSGNHLDYPDLPANSVLGDIEVVALVAADDWTPTGYQVILSKWPNDGSANHSYRLLINQTSGTIQLSASPDGTTKQFFNSTSAPVVTDGAPLWIKANVDIDDGAGNRVARFYTSPDGTVWTQLGSSVSQAGVNSQIADTTTVLRIGANTSDTERFAGKVYYVEVRNGIDGPVVAKFDAREIETPWTINGTGWNWAGSAPLDLQEMSLKLDATSGNHFATPDSPVLSITGDLDIRAEIEPNNWLTTQVIMAKDTVSGQRSFYLYLHSSAVIGMSVSLDGTAQIFPSRPHGLTGSSRKWVRVTRVSASGATEFFLSDDGVKWTTLGVNNSTAGAIFDSTALMEIGSRATGGSERFSGKIYYIEVRNGINGPIVARFDPSAVAKLATRNPTVLTQPGGSPNLVTPNQASIETDATGWITGSGTPTLARSTAQFLDGAASLSIIAVAAGPAAMSAYLNPLTTVSVIPGKSYTAKISFRTAVTARSCSARILWMNAASGFVSASVGTSVGDTTSGWTEGTVTGVAPATAAYGRIEAYIDAVVAGEEHFIDRISLAETPVVWTAAGSAWDWEPVSAAA
jgi:hypothetical protein